MKPVLLGSVALGLGLAGLLGPGAGGSSAPTEPNPAPQEVVVTGENPDGRGQCSLRRRGVGLMRFNKALNAADTKELRKFWREKKRFRGDRGRRARNRGTFRWFSLTNSPSPSHKFHFVAYRPIRALRYVRESRGFRLQLTEVRAGSYQGLWVLDDGRVYQVVGKGAFRCGRGQFLIKVWSMAVQDPGTAPPDLCPAPPGGAPPRTLIVCAPRGAGRDSSPSSP